MLLHTLLSWPLVYRAIQALYCGEGKRKAFCDEYIRPFPGMRILDIGCGPAEILDVLPEDISYTGFDSNAKYIEYASRKMRGTGRNMRNVTLRCEYVQQADFESCPSFDLVMALGVLHHLDDDGAKSLLNLAEATLKPGGRLLTSDGCFINGQNPLAKFLISHDRGKFVRTPQEYLGLFSERSFTVQHVIVEKHSFPPYTYIIIEALSHA